MAVDLTNDDINKMCMHMRLIEYLRGYPDILEKDAAMKTEYENLCRNFDVSMGFLTEAQRDLVLETHKIQLDHLKKQKKGF